MPVDDYSWEEELDWLWSQYSHIEKDCLLSMCATDGKLRNICLKAIKKMGNKEPVFSDNCCVASNQYFVADMSYLNSVSKLCRPYTKDAACIYIMRMKTLLNSDVLNEKAFGLILQEINEYLKIEKTREHLQLRKRLVVVYNTFKERLKKANRKRFDESFIRNSSFPSAAKSLSLQFNDTRGRHVVSNDHIKKGDIIFIEDPFAFVVIQPFKETMCHYCCDQIKTLYSCPLCQQASYCGPVCKSDDEQCHKFECPGMTLLYEIGMAHLALKIILRVGKFNNLKTILKSDMVKKKREDASPKGYEGIYHLYFSDDISKEDLFRYSMTAQLLTTYLEERTTYMPKNNVSARQMIFDVLLRHILQLTCNAQAISQVMLPKDNVFTIGPIEGIQLIRVATAIYPAVSTLNHSCDPDVVPCFDKCRLIIRARRDLQEGYEICNCYGPHSRRMPKVERLTSLREQYHFQCNCSSCSQDLDFMDRRTAFKCTDCPGPLIAKSEQLGVCMDCGRVSVLSQKQIIYKEIIAHLKEQASETTDPHQAVEIYLKIWLKGREIFYPFHKDVMDAADKMAMYFAVLGELELASEILKTAMHAVKFTFGNDSVEYAYEMNKASELFNHVESKKELSKEIGKKSNKLLKFWLNPEYDPDEIVFDQHAQLP